MREPGGPTDGGAGGVEGTGDLPPLLPLSLPSTAQSVLEVLGPLLTAGAAEPTPGEHVPAATGAAGGEASAAHEGAAAGLTARHTQLQQQQVVNLDQQSSAVGPAAGPWVGPCAPWGPWGPPSGALLGPGPVGPPAPGPGGTAFRPYGGQGYGWQWAGVGMAVHGHGQGQGQGGGMWAGAMQPQQEQEQQQRQQQDAMAPQPQQLLPSQPSPGTMMSGVTVAPAAAVAGAPAAYGERTTPASGTPGDGTAATGEELSWAAAEAAKAFGSVLAASPSPSPLNGTAAAAALPHAASVTSPPAPQQRTAAMTGGAEGAPGEQARA